MPGPAELLLICLWSFGPGGWWVEAQLEDAEVRRALPVAWLERTAARSRIRFHQLPGGVMALYLPPEPPPAGGAAQREAAAVAAPATDVPTIVLYAPYYLADGHLVALGEMPVDVAEHYFHAWMEAYLDGEVRGDVAVRETLERRAAELLLDVPPSRRLEAYLTALAELGAHLLSVANEIARTSGRFRARGKDLCPLIEHPATLFGLWRRSWGETPFPGRYFLPATPDAPGSGGWRTSRHPLKAEDKAWLLRQVFAGFWRGDPRQDFAWLCPLPAGGG